MTQTQKITPCLWFDRNAEEAVNHYLSIFKNARIESLSRYGEGMPLPKGTVLTIIFELEGQRFYEPTDRGYEKMIGERLRRIRGEGGDPKGG